MISKAYRFLCDNCGECSYYMAENLTEAKMEARADGWKMRGKRGCLCSEECYLKTAMENI